MHEIQAKSILSAKNGINIYRGCQHGCIYCDSRSLCYNMQHEFEDVAVKTNALSLLKDALIKKRKKCMIGMGSMSDPYMPLEGELCYTRRFLQLLDFHGFGGTLITKSDLVLRDLDIIKSINKKAKFVLQMTMTTFDEDLCKIVEPNVATTKRRAEVLNVMRDNDVPTVVWLSPVLPFINDNADNINGILDYCIQAKVKGIICFGMGMTLRDGNREYFYQKLDEHFPGIKDKYKLLYGNSYQIVSFANSKLSKIFYDRCRQHGIMTDVNEIFEYINHFEEKQSQLSLFDF
ncbi:MAG: radical SAM protein [Clostridia bacterium]|nr:radical SAM protein [Clostridia bacterium]